ncbi:MAG: RNA polymerase factor sigma-54 [Deltaproteobacteria bacterium]|nr:RNA polymerase factor sigma-54 [Deltaproteobacteria bacterium]
MALELKQHLKMTQQLIMTPQLQQAIKLLQLSRLELKEYIEQEFQANPLLEIDTEPSPPEEKDGVEDQGLDTSKIEQSRWEAYLESYGQERIPQHYEGEERSYLEAIATRAEGLTEHLLWQLRLNHFTERQRIIGVFIIGNIDSNGYLSTDIDTICTATDTTEEEVISVLKQIQTFDPVGVASRDLKECLFVQARIFGFTDSIVWKIIDSHLEDLQTKNFDKIAQGLGATVEEVSWAAQIISKMEPRPARNYSDEPQQYIVPDIYVFKVDDDYMIALNEEDIPKLTLDKEYQCLLISDKTGQLTKDYLTERLKSAQWLMKSIRQRQSTLCKVTASIMRFQKDFLDHGINHLKPLVLRDVADDVGMHESTISRVTSNKYVHTPQGIFELKFFFSSGIAKSNGGFMASQSVKNEIENLIKVEDPKNPLSDQVITVKLREKGIAIARRTVAKYREVMGILPSNRRKKHY